jgi:hypothetical protein
MTVKGWEGMPEEARAEAVACYELGTELLDIIVRKARNRDVALNAAFNVLGQIIAASYDDPNVIATQMAANLVRLVAVKHAGKIDAGREH